MFAVRLLAAVLFVLTGPLIQLILFAEGQNILNDGDLRLVSNSGTTFGTSGRLEVYYSFQWGTVCIDFFGAEEALVACRQLGFTTYANYGSVGAFGFNEASSATRTWLDNVMCSGSESRLIDCGNTGLGLEDCNHSQDVGLICFLIRVTSDPPTSTSFPVSPVSPTTGNSHGDVRLSSNDGYTSGIAGRVEVYYNSQLLTVCDTSVQKEVADVVCRQLGFTGAAYFGTVNDLNYRTVSSFTPYLDDVFCIGSESRLEDCSHRAVFTSLSCSHSNDLAVICKGTMVSGASQAVETGSLRLNTEGVDNPRSFSGRLEVFANGQWGTVCDDGFGLTEANSACRQLGFVEALYYGTVGFIGFEEASNGVPILLDGVGCSSDIPPPRLIDCFHNGIGVHDCAHNEDIALVCLGVGSLRLTDFSVSTSFSRDEGRLEVYVNGRWGTVCDDLFDQTDADVACRQLGFSRATTYGNDNSLRYSTSPPIWLDDLACRSDDDFLLLCNHRGIGVENCGHSEDIELLCARLGSGAAIAIGIIVPVVIIAMCVIICCCCYCCYAKNKKRQSVSRPVTRTVQPTTTAFITTTTAAVPSQAAYPMQAYPTAPQQQAKPYPVQRFDPQPGYSTVQGSAYPTQHQQPPSEYLVPYPNVQQQPPAPYPAMQQQPSAPYTSVHQQPPAPYTSVQQQPPAPYPSAQPQTVYPPAEPVKSDLYTDSPPPYPGTAPELAAYPTYQQGGYPQTDVYPPRQ